MAISGGDGSIILNTKVDESGLSKGLSSLKSGVGAVGKAFATVGVAAAAGFAAVTTSAVKSYAEFEQLKGGVETLFKDSADVLMGYADRAYQTAGLSANEYMSTVTSFSASLLQSLGGDTEAAANYADQAIIDMADNANKMGTSMEAIQNAYQGFAKQNYTMLDNLKLGYGGTKEEMQRLLDDASKISGIKYDISSFADVTQAIHVMQTELGITGTTALEASTTIQGSASAMKASWQNLLTGLADPTQNFEALLQNFITSIGTFAGNLLPVVQTAAQGVLQMVQGLLPQLGSMVSEMLPVVVEGVSGIVSGIIEVLPQIVQAIIGLLPQLINATTQLITQIAMALPTLMQTIVSALPNVIQSIVSALPTIIPALINGIVQAIVILVAALPQIIQPIIDNLPMIITSITGALISNLPILIQAAIQLVIALVAALPQIIMALLEAMGGIAVQIGEALFNALPAPMQNAFSAAFDAIKAVWNLVQPYFSAVWESIKAIFSVVGAVLGGFFETAWTAIKAVWNVVTSYFSAIWDTIAGIFSVVKNVLQGNWEEAWNAIKGIVSSWGAYFQSIWDGIKAVFSAVGSWFSGVFEAAKNAVTSIWDSVTTFFSDIWQSIKDIFSDAKDKFLSVGENIVDGIRNGIENAWNNLKEWFTGLFDNLIDIAKKILGIKSPSREFMWIAKMLVAGLTKGIDKYGYLAVYGVKELSRNVVDVFKEIIPEMASNILSDTRSEVQKVLDDMNEELLESERLYNQESERLKDSQLESDKQYLDELKQIAERERKIYDARKKDVENLKETIVNAYSDMASEALDSIEELQKTQESFAEKLAGYGNLTYEKTYRNKYGQQVTETFLEDPSKQTAFLEEYYDTLMKVKERGDIPREFFATIRDMGIEEGFEYANALLEMTDADFDKYVKEWQRKQEASQNISKALYADEASDLATSINNEFDDLKDDMFEIGKDSAGEFGDGFIQQLKYLAHDIRYAIQDALGGVTVGGIGPIISGEGDVITVPALATGGIIPHKTLAMIGERGREAVLPLENNTGWMDMLADRIVARTGGASSTVVLEIDGREFGRAVVEQGNREKRRIGTRLVSR